MSDVGVAELGALVNLELLTLRRANVNRDGYERLCRALPNTLIVTDFASFPHSMQVRRIVIADNQGASSHSRTLSSEEQVGRVLVVLEGWMSQARAGWREVDVDQEDCVWVRIEGQQRVLRECGLTRNQFISRLPYVSVDRGVPISEHDAAKLRRALGLEAAGR